MADFLTDEWFDAMIERAAGAIASPAITMTLQQTVTTDSTVVWHTIIAGGTVQTVRGEAATADVRLVTNLATAKGINDGTVSAQRAFLDGELQIGGDLNALMAAREALAGLKLSTR